MIDQVSSSCKTNKIIVNKTNKVKLAKIKTLNNRIINLSSLNKHNNKPNNSLSNLNNNNKDLKIQIINKEILSNLIIKTNETHNKEIINKDYFKEFSEES